MLSCFPHLLAGNPEDPRIQEVLSPLGHFNLSFPNHIAALHFKRHSPLGRPSSQSSPRMFLLKGRKKTHNFQLFLYAGGAQAVLPWVHTSHRQSGRDFSAPAEGQSCRELPPAASCSLCFLVQTRPQLLEVFLIIPSLLSFCSVALAAPGHGLGLFNEQEGKGKGCGMGSIHSPVLGETCHELFFLCHFSSDVVTQMHMFHFSLGAGRFLVAYICTNQGKKKDFQAVQPVLFGRYIKCSLKGRNKSAFLAGIHEF